MPVVHFGQYHTLEKMFESVKIALLTMSVQPLQLHHQKSEGDMNIIATEVR